MVDRTWPLVLDQHLMFLRLTVIELRRLADREPAISTYLRHVADQIEGEANAVAEHPDRPPGGFV